MTEHGPIADRVTRSPIVAQITIPECGSAVGYRTQEAQVFCQHIHYVVSFTNSPDTILVVIEHLTARADLSHWENNKGSHTWWRVKTSAKATREITVVDISEAEAAITRGVDHPPNESVEEIEVIEPVYRHFGDGAGGTSQNWSQIVQTDIQAQRWVQAETTPRMDTNRLAFCKRLENQYGPTKPIVLEITPC